MPKHFHPRNCPRCGETGDGGRHTKKDWRYHPDAGHGFTKQLGWSKPPETFLEPMVPMSMRGKNLGETPEILPAPMCPLVPVNSEAA